MMLIRTSLVFIGLLAITACGQNEASPSKTFKLTSQGVYAAALASNSEFTLVGSLNHGASLWRIADKERLFDWNHQSGSYSDLVAAGFSPDNSRAVTTDPRTLVLWNTQTGESLGYWATPGAVLAVALAPDGENVLMGLKDHSAVFFNAANGDYSHTFLHEGPVGSVALSLDGQYAITGSDDNFARIWSLSDGKMVQELAHTNPVRVTAISQTGKYTFTASQGEKVAIWDAKTGNRLHTISSKNPGVTAARFSQDERYLLVGYLNHRVELWDTTTGRQIKAWAANAKNPFHPSGTAILAVGFAENPNKFFAIAGDGRMMELRRSAS